MFDKFLKFIIWTSLKSTKVLSKNLQSVHCNKNVSNATENAREENQ